MTNISLYLDLQADLGNHASWALFLYCRIVRFSAFHLIFWGCLSEIDKSLIIQQEIREIE